MFAMPVPWKRERQRLEGLLLLAATKVVPLLSRRSCWLIAQFAGATIAVLDRRGRKVALSNLEAAFGNELSILHRRKIVRESFQSLARTMVDLLWGPRLTRENWSRYIEIVNLERFENDIAPTGTCIFAVPHYGNFEWLNPATAFLGYPASILTQEFKNPFVGPIFDQLRATFGQSTVPRAGGILRLYKTLRVGGGAAILVDLSLRPHLGAVAINCFGLKTSVPFAHAWLHERTGVPIIPIHCEPLPEGRWRIVFHEKLTVAPGSSYQQVVQACWDRFEPVIRQAPGPWLWMYKLWRFRPANPDRKYPFYANTDVFFDTLLQGGKVRLRKDSPPL